MNDYLVSTQELVRHYGACFKPIGALETEQRYTVALEVSIAAEVSVTLFS